MRSSSPRAHLAVASTAVLLTAADTYVVVLALTDMMAGVGLGIESLHRATPIVSGFLVGYVATLPLIGRLADLVSRRQALGWCLLVFTVGSVITALASDLGVLVAGRVIQGVGGGGLVPATLALVADQWPPERRGAPLGVVGAVQELGAVAGPVVGAAILAIGDWRLIFWFGAIAGIALYAVLRLLPAAAELASPGGVPVTPPAPDVVHRRSPPGVHAEASSAPSVSVPAGPEAWALPTPSVSVPPGPEISTPPRAGRSGARLVAEARPGAAGGARCADADGSAAIGRRPHLRVGLYPGGRQRITRRNADRGGNAGAGSGAHGIPAVAKPSTPHARRSPVGGAARARAGSGDCRVLEWRSGARGDRAVGDHVGAARGGRSRTRRLADAARPRTADCRGGVPAADAASRGGERVRGCCACRGRRRRAGLCAAHGGPNSNCRSLCALAVPRCGARRRVDRWLADPSTGVIAC
ncbi:MAG: MFS transporter [Actinomycetales bacterium]|nr:MFS transporter [Actinomycetales bacterium]